MKEELIFQERQRFNQWWNILLLVLFNGIFIYGCIIQLGMGKPFGNNPMSDTMLIVVTILVALITIASIFFIRLDTVINEEGVYERMFPLQLRFGFTPWDHVSNVAVKKGLLGKFGGGLGIRYGFRKKAYTVSGNNALQLTLKNNKRIYIGTQQPEALIEFLDKLDAERKQK
ncbi:MAG: hypothetical protein FWD60_08610 [Candidatus Azobacteroides sp.]|nr:hypothetical protein [Candidatus Azobacteroides sp.]